MRKHSSGTSTSVSEVTVVVGSLGEDLEMLAAQDDFILEDKERLVRYMGTKRSILPEISEAIASLRREFPDARFTLSYSDDEDPFITIMIYGVKLRGERYWRFREMARRSYNKAAETGLVMVTMPGV